MGVVRSCVLRWGVIVFCCWVVGWYPLIFWVHLVNLCIIFSGRCGSSLLRFFVVMGIPLAILSLMLEYACVMVVVVVL